jgi:hypothetical protein
MAQPSSRDEFTDYCLRRLGAPVLEINVDVDQVDDLIDDAIQFFQENCYNGMERCYLVHEITADDIARFDTTTSTTASGTVWKEDNNYLPVPSHVLGISKVFGMVGSNIRSNLFGLEYQLFLNDLYQFGSVDILSYYLVKQFLESMDMVLNNGSFQQFRYNMRRDRLYLDINQKFLTEGNYLLIEAHRLLNPNDVTEMYNDMFMKRYATALIKRQWGQNLIKFNNVQLPGGITMNGRQLYEDAVVEIEKIESEVLSKYAVPPLDMIG